MQVLRSSRAIRLVFRERNVVHGQAMTLHARQVDNGGGKAAVVAGRAVGRAVDRNRAKRRLRAVIAARGVPEDLQLVVVARPAACNLVFPALEAEFSQLLVRVSRRVRVRA